MGGAFGDVDAVAAAAVAADDDFAYLNCHYDSVMRNSRLLINHKSWADVNQSTSQTPYLTKAKNLGP